MSKAVQPSSLGETRESMARAGHVIGPRTSSTGVAEDQTFRLQRFVFLPRLGSSPDRVRTAGGTMS